LEQVLCLLWVWRGARALRAPESDTAPLLVLYLSVDVQKIRTYYSQT
jgi:hypothetical protein